MRQYDVGDIAGDNWEDEIMAYDLRDVFAAALMTATTLRDGLPMAEEVLLKGAITLQSVFIAVSWRL